ncbi:MAG: hypothetical protein M9939_00930 [Mesorhizobium sp.]|nr:hypothetical protein [Mesorhizobium sp.]MCO5159672.1 hypothetical protein [Mesorhizobium sp.]
MAKLTKAHGRALKALAEIPAGANLDISEFDDEEFWLGIGVCVGKGHAVCRGDWCFRITDAGRSALTQGE